MVLAKVGSSELVGLYVLGLSITAPVFVCASLQLRAIQATDAQSEYGFADYLALRLVSTLAALLLASTIAWLVGHRDTALWAVVLVAVAKSAESFSDVIYGLLQQRERMDRVAQSKACHGLALLVGVGGGALATGSIVGAAGGLVVARLLVLLGCDIPAAVWVTGETGSWIRRTCKLLRPRFDARQLLGLCSMGLPLAIVTLLVSLEMNIPQYFVTHHLGLAELGVFGAVAALITAGGMFTRAMNQVASPRLAAMHHAGDSQGFRRLLARMLAAYLVLGGLGLAVVPVIGRWLLVTLFRSEFGDHVDLLLVVMLAAAAAYLSGALTTAMIALRAISSQLPLRLLTAATSLVICLLLVPEHGLYGAGWALVCAKIPFVLAALVIVWRKTRAAVEGGC